jgi:predicted adenine nucleotide alpha hydrolase (AANH) superfamily ATPase
MKEAKDMDLLLHTCCGPCGTYTTKSLAEEGIRPTLYYTNSNIHPYREWKQRLESLRRLASIRDLDLWVDSDYQLERFLEATLPMGKDRCAYCYRIRLGNTAQKAREEGFTSYSTTLLISPYQNHELLRQIGEECGREHKVEFVYRDFRPGFRQSQQMARELELYRQGYCGCILSEKERYYRPNAGKAEVK